VLELVIAGTPEVRQRIPLELDGTAAFPLIGGLPAGGRTLAEVRARVQELLPQQVFRNRSFTGSEALQVIEPHEIHVSIAAYRPVYLQGDVARTGSVEFQPGLTVRQAVAVSGGYDLLRSGAGGSLVEALELRNQHETLAIGLAKERARIWRLESALGRSAAFDRSQFAAVDPDTLAEIVRLESEHLKTYRNDHQSQKAELTAAIDAATGRLDSLTTQSKSEEEGSRLDEVEMERVNDLFRKGLVPITRVNDVRRVALLASTRALQTRIAAENVRKEREELRNQLRRTDDARRMEILKELQEANANAERLQTQVRSAREKMLLAGSSRLALARSAGAKLDIAIFRKGQGGADADRRHGGFRADAGRRGGDRLPGGHGPRRPGLRRGRADAVPVRPPLTRHARGAGTPGGARALPGIVTPSRRAPWPAKPAPARPGRRTAAPRPRRPRAPGSTG
jgi:polysaccharide export outer membrane protein